MRIVCRKLWWSVVGIVLKVFVSWKVWFGRWSWFVVQIVSHVVVRVVVWCGSWVDQLVPVVSPDTDRCLVDVEVVCIWAPCCRVVVALAVP